MLQPFAELLLITMITQRYLISVIIKYQFCETLFYFISKVSSYAIKMPRDIAITNKLIREEKQTFIIAEAGVNHNGDINLAKKLIDIAKDSGCDAVKFQTFKTEGVMTKPAKKADYQKEMTGEGTQYDMAKKLELKYNDFIELKKYCGKLTCSV